MKRGRKKNSGTKTKKRENIFMYIDRFTPLVLEKKERKYFIPTRGYWRGK